jgi:tetratricopeptide (TPR) repeat protein
MAETPAVVAARADTLVALGRRADARALLVARHEHDRDAQATLLMRASDLAREDGDVDAARTALDRVLALSPAASLHLLAQARMAQLEAASDLTGGLAALDALADGAPTATGRAAVLGIAADTLADAGRFADALARLDAAPASSDVAPQRARLLARWIARLAAEDDVTGVTIVYTLHRTALDGAASPETARTIADAFARIGLREAALRILRLRDPGDDPRTTAAIVALTAPPAEPSHDPPIASLADDAEPVVRRGVALLAHTQPFAPTLVAASSGDGHGR